MSAIIFWNVYASDRRMRLNLGIRRRLAPLLDNDLRKIQLMNSLLMSMPGTPIIYYGDEIGMGDNIYLGDRDGVRTPMQWSPDRNGGFSRADPAKLYLPPIMDSIYGYEAVNVEAQQRDPSSLLNWMKRMIAVRQGHPAFGRGTLRLLYPHNRKILAYLREHEGDIVLCVVNLSRAAQAVELTLPDFKGRVPVELLGRSPFPPIGDLPYMLTLPAYGFYWFVLPEEAELPRWHEDLPEPLPDFITLVARGGLRDLVGGQSARDLTREVLPAFLAKQRWFAAKDAAIDKVEVGAWAEFNTGGDSQLLAEVEVSFAGGEAPQRYFMPLGTSFDEQALTYGWPLLSFSLAQIRRGAKVGALYDGMAAEHFPRAAIAAMRAGRELQASDGTIRFTTTSALDGLEIPPDIEIRRMHVEQSNSSMLVGEHAVFKAYRRLAYGGQPELEIGRFLTEEAGYTNTPPLLGAIERVEPDGRITALAAAFGFVRNQGDGWLYTTDYLHRELERLRLAVALPDDAAELEDDDPHAFYLTRARMLGQRTAEMHRAFAVPTQDPAFAAEPITGRDLQAWGRGCAQTGRCGVRGAAPGSAPSRACPKTRKRKPCLSSAEACMQRIKDLTRDPVHASKTRLHGDYHLGQVLVAQADFYILDFEGEPARPLAERRAKTSPLKDVAGMLRSFDYAAWSAVLIEAEFDPASTEVVLPLAEQWRQDTEHAFLESYRATIAGCISYPDDPDEAQRLLELFLLEKALYEICYEAANRPAWLTIPIKGVAGQLASRDQADDTS